MIKTNNALKEHIPLYNEKNLTVFPCKDKRPLVKFKDLEDQNIDELFEMFNDDHELAIRTGKGLVVVDIDNKEIDGINGFQSFAKLETEFGELPETLTVSTRNGGLHKYFKVIDDLELPNHQNLRNALGVDVRGTNGYVIAPPSSGYSFKSIKKIAYLPKSWFDIIERKTPELSLTNVVDLKVRNDEGLVIDGRDVLARDIVYRKLFELDLEKRLNNDSFAVHELTKESWFDFMVKASTKDPNKTLEQEGWTEEKIYDKAKHLMTRYLNGDFNDELQKNYENSTSFNIAELEKELTPEVVEDSYVSVETLLGQDFPPLEWVVKDWILAKTICGFYAPAGVGKSSIAQLIATSLSLGKSVSNKLKIERSYKTLYVACEDDSNIFQARQKSLNSQLGIVMDSDLNNLYFMDRLGHDNRLCSFDANSEPTLTKFYYHLEKVIKEAKIEFIVLDVLQDFFGGNEIIRSDVNYFIKAVLGKLISDLGVTILLIAHPSLAGQNGGHKYSGSTSWIGGFRSLLYLEKNKEEDYLILNKFKSNYSKAGDDQNVYFHYQSGCFLPFEKDQQMNNDLLQFAPRVRDAIRHYNNFGTVLKKSKGLAVNLIKQIVVEISEDMIAKCINYLEEKGQITYIEKKGWQVTKGII